MPGMSRSRDYITAEGRRRLSGELDYLWRDKRPAVTRALADAAAEGDRSENAEYIYRKKELREIDRRIRYLSRRLDELVVPERAPDDPSRVFFGAWVAVADEAGEESAYRIVGADETDAEAGWISLHSPMARALLGAREGDTVRVPRPAGEVTLEVVEVRYSGEGG